MNNTINTYTIPEDLLIDTFSILINSSIPFKIIGVNENESSAILVLKVDNTKGNHKKAIQNIKENVEEYYHYRYNVEK